MCNFVTESEFFEEEALNLKKKEARENRSVTAIRMDRLRKRKEIADRYWTFWLRTGSAPESWLEGLSDELVAASRKKMVGEMPGFAKIRVVTK